ncbi:MAG TPA: gamma-glutamylcyclotransferase family protein [Solirubrobacterales bacterium]|nr:gamma-glutamylcyclotransferase family protein [Solirubrobacterales bacterium]
MPEPRIDYVFGYGSLVARRAALMVEGARFPAVPARLGGFRRLWGVAMNNWEAAPSKKHYVDRADGRAPRVRIAFLDIEEKAGAGVNGLAIPVDAAHLAALDVREVNYERIDVSTAVEPRLPHRVFTYRGTDAARARRREGESGAEICVSSDYLAAVRRAFADLGADALAEFELTTAVLPFPQRDLELIQPAPGSEDISVS